MAARVTIQNIADALGVSRNTVSKAINNTGVLAESTREKILQKAVEMGYKQFSYMSYSDLNLPGSSQTADKNAGEAPAPSDARPKVNGSIALLTGIFLEASHFSSTMLDKMQKELALLGYSLTIHKVTTKDFRTLSLPATFLPETAAGIICFEVFNPEYAQMLCELPIPVLFVDYPASIRSGSLKADRLMMENRSNIHLLVDTLAKRGYRRFGFIGDHLHCMSFFERFMAFREACDFLGIPLEEKFLITGKKSGTNLRDFDTYRDYLKERFSTLEDLPDIFICANDFVAIDALQVFRQLGIRVPADVMLAGFDDSPESKVVTPPLTTIHIHSQIMGLSAVWLLMSRIHEPGLHYRTVYTETTLLLRESTRD